MKLNLSLKSIFRRRTWIPYFVLAIALLLTILATFYVAETAHDKDRLRFENAVGRTQDDIQNRLETYMALLRAGSGLFAGSDQVTLEEFRTFVNRLELQDRYPGIQGIGFSARLMPEDKDALITQMREQGLEYYTIYPEYKRNEYHAIIYLEPIDWRNQAAIGFDMFSEPVRRAAMERARDTGIPAASGRVTLVQEIDNNKQAGFLIYVPLYRNGVIPETLAERREALMGFIYSPFRADDLMKGIFGRAKYRSVDFEIYDGTQLSPENLLHRSNRNSPSNRPYQPWFTTTRTIDVAGRTWSIYLASRPEFELVSGRNLVPYILVGGLLISFVLFGVTRSQARARVAAERAVAALRQSEQALRESEARLRRLVDANIIGIIIGDTHGKIIEANDAFLNIVGYSREEAMSDQVNWCEITPPEHRHLDESAMEEMMRTGSHVPFEKEYIRKDGTRVPVLVGTALLGGLQPLGVGFILDLTQQKQAEESLRNSEKRFRTLVEQSSLSTQILAPDGRTIQVNRAWETLWGLTLTQLEDYNILEDEQLVAKGIMPYLKKAFAGEATAIPPILYDPNQTLPGMTAHQEPQRWVQAYIYPVKDEAGNIGEVVLIHEDITDRKRVEKEREQLLTREQAAREEAEAANRMKDEFLATLSHELRTPLNAMIGWTNLLRTRKFDEATAARALETIARNTKSLAQLIEDVLDVSRIITGKLRLNIHPVELAPVIEGAIETVLPAANAKEIQMEFQFDQSVGQVWGDSARLQQVVWNLLSNAVKFTPKGGLVEVRLEKVEEGFKVSKLQLENSAQQTNIQPSTPAQPSTQYAQIRVRDTGQGISSDFLPYVFERFRQADSTTTRSHGGLGLGLAIVRHLVELHGGTVYAESPGIGQGATFIVELPIKAVSISANEPEPVQLTQQDEALVIDSISLEGLMILIVDDEAEARELLIAMLCEYGAEVKATASASEALEALSDFKPHVLVSDIAMPGEDGYSLIRKLRKRSVEQGGRIPAVALTAYASAEDRKQALLAGFQLHVPKPVDPAELAAVIANLAGRIGNINANSD